MTTKNVDDHIEEDGRMDKAYSNVKGVEKKPWTFENQSDESVSLDPNMLEGWYIFHLKGRIHSSVLSTKTSLYDIREPSYK